MATACLAAAATTGLGVWAAWRTRTPAPSQTAGDDPSAAPAQGATQTAFEDALENLPDPLLIASAGEPDDLAGKRLVFANAAARALLRIPRDGALLLSAIRRPEVLEAVDEALFGGVSGTVSFETGGAQDRFWRIWTTPLSGRADSSLCLILMRDETDARRNERMRADFLANASHELRTPLASLTGFIETLRGHARDDEGARERFLGIMAVQADRMARLVDDLMSLSRIELNEHIPPDGRCDLSVTVTDVLDALGPIATTKQVRLRPDLPAPGKAEIVADRDQVIQVVQNLVDNALKYSPPGADLKVIVRSSLKKDAASASDLASPRLTSPDGGRQSLLSPDRTDGELYCMVRVVDQGPGMAKRHLLRLAERFYRVEGQKSGERSGTGLGLAIVKHIVNRHRGGLWVESAPGAGAQFTAYFPQAKPVPQAQPDLGRLEPDIVTKPS